MGCTTKDQLLKLGEGLKKNQYGQYLINREKERINRRWFLSSEERAYRGMNTDGREKLRPALGEWRRK